MAGSLKWKHTFSNKLYGVLTGAYSRYEYGIASDRNPSTSSSFAYRLDQRRRSSISAITSTPGTPLIRRQLHLYNIRRASSRRWAKVAGEARRSAAREGPGKRLYLSDRFDVSPGLSLYAGLRYSLFNALGPRRCNEYLAGASQERKTP